MAGLDGRMRIRYLFLLTAAAGVLLFRGRCFAAGDQFFQFSVDQDRVRGAADFSFLNRPLTPADRLTVCGDQFCRSGSRDPVRLFGVNMAFGANFPEEKDAVRIARRLRRLGVNLVRLHHMDTSPDRDPQTARSILTTDPYPALNPVAVRRLRAFLDALKAEGIYVNLNLHVGYTFRPGVDGVPPFPAGLELPRLGKPVHIFHPRMIALQVEFAEKLLAALNLVGDPVLGMVEIDNESSLLEAWQKGALQKYMVGEYKTELDRQYAAFLKGAPASEDAWLRFLVDRDRYYLDSIAAAVRRHVRAPIAGTQVSFYGPLILDSHAGMDYQDNHFYIDHYNFPNRSWDSQDWRIRNSSATGAGLGPYLNMAIARQAGKPYTVSEYNQQWPNQQAAEITPTLAAFAAFQGWASIMHFAYEHGRDWDKGLPSGFNINGDWTKWPNLGQSAWLFRTGAVAPARTLLVVPLPEDLRLRAAKEKRVGNVAAALSSALGYDPAAALLHRVAITAQTAAPVRQAPSPAQIAYDRETKVFTIAAPQAAGIFGYTRKASAGALEVELAPAARGFVAMLLTSLDRRPLATSRRMLLSNPGYTLGTLPGSDPPRPQRLVNYPGSTDWFTLEPEPASTRPSGNRNATAGPVWMEQVECTIALRNVSKRLAVYPLGAAGERLDPLAAGRIPGGWRIHLRANSPWFELTAM